MSPMKLVNGKVSKSIIWTNIMITLVYSTWWISPSHIGNPLLYTLLLFGEFYHVCMALTFWHTIWPWKKRNSNIQDITNFSPSVDVFITVAGEPVSIITQTIKAAKQIHYENKKIFILNDGYVAHKDNWQAVEQLAQMENVNCITRRIPGGAKAGNINHALKQTTGEIVVIFDADMKASPNFLQKVVPFFHNETLGFVQTPQYYENYPLNQVSNGAWEQQAFFFGAIMQGKSNLNAAFICGTNVAIRRVTLEQVGGMCETNIAEDFLTSLFIHQNRWQSVYLNEVLSKGLAPEDLQSYYSQQLRWARGSLEVLFGQNPLFKRGLTVNQKIAYLSSALYYFNGLVVLIDMLMPLIFLFTGVQPVAASTTSFAIFFIPFIICNLYTLYLASDKTFTFRAISFSQASWTLQLVALVSVLRKKKMGFTVTPKQAQQGNFFYLVYPHVFYIVVTLIAIAVGIYREGINPSVATNIAWAAFNICTFMPFIQASFRQSVVVPRYDVKTI